MKRIELDGIRYGERDFDEDYVNWGFHDEETQIKESKSILKILNRDNMRIFDIGCGLGTHDVFWAKLGHQVSAIDISETYLNIAKERAKKENVNINFKIQNVLDLDYDNEFDLVTWIENSFFDKDVVLKVFHSLNSSGVYIYDVRNPEHPKMKRFKENFNTWREEDGVYYLDKHQINRGTGVTLDQWIKIDTKNDFLEIKNYEHKPTPLAEQINILKESGFRAVKLMDIDGDIFDDSDSTYWLWVVCYK